MDTTLVGWDGFSRVAATFVFNSRGGYSFSGALTSVSPPSFLCVFGYFLLPLGILFCLMFLFYFYLTLSLLDD